MMGLFSPITWHEVTFECSKCHKQKHLKRDFSEDVYKQLDGVELSTLEVKKVFHKPIVLNIPILKIKLLKEIRPVIIIR